MRLRFSLLVGVLGAGLASAASVNRADLVVETVVTGLSVPTSLAFVGSDDVLVLQKNNGQVRRVVGGALQAAAVLDLAVHFSSERGLLGIATAPDFVHSRHVYLYYTVSPTGGDTNDGEIDPVSNRIARYTWNGSALVDPVTVLDLPVLPGHNHDGGVLATGPDDALYAVIGDLNRNGQLQNHPNGPVPDDTGVILRIGPLGQPVAGNPFYDPFASDAPIGRYWAYGVRNSFGLGFDPITGLLWDTENGPSSMDEINLVEAGFNSGWEQIMGPDSRDPQNQNSLWVAPGSQYSDPEFSWLSPVAPTALAFVTSPVLACDLRSSVLVGNTNCGQLYRFGLTADRRDLVMPTMALQDRVADDSSGNRCSGNGGEIDAVAFGSAFGGITDVEQGPDGAIWVVSIGQGALFRIRGAVDAAADPDGDRADTPCDCAPNDAGAWGTPDEIPRLRLSAAIPARLSWQDQGALLGPATTYRVVTGDLSALRSSGDFDDACTLGADSTTPGLTDSRGEPPVGSAYWYLVRAENACGNGTFGDGTGVPDPRDPLDAAPPPPCSLDRR